MKYEFHVGDYVETKDGDIGFISEINTDEDTLWYGGFYWYCTSGRGPRTKKDTYIIPNRPDVDMTKFFNRIGQYDFTKKAEDKDDNKIEPLVKSRLLETVDGEDECYFDSREVIEKINELVEGVNRLEKKVNGMAQS